MRIRFCIIIVVLLTATVGTYAKSGSAQVTEHQLKAAFLYNFLVFADWPKGKLADSNAIVIGLLGEDDFKSAFDPLRSKQIKGKRITIINLGKFSRFLAPGDSGKSELTSEIEQLKSCHLLFVCDSEKKYYREIIDAVKDS
jgi:hypothetical protein